MDTNKEIERYNPTPEQGLDEEIVSQRKQDKLVNKTPKTVGKSIWKILTDNVLNAFSVLLLIVAILLIVIKKYEGFFLLAIFVLSVSVNLYQDISARRLMRKYKLDSTPKALVIRSNLKYEVSVEELVIDDIVELKNSEEVFVDSIIVKGTALVDESLINGKSSLVYKNVGDTILAGSIIKNGNPVVKVDKVGQNSLLSKANQIKKPNNSLFGSLKTISLIVCASSLFLGIFMLVVYGLQKVFADYASFVSAFNPILNCIASILPWGLYFVTGLLLLISALYLKKNKVSVLESKSVEMLSQVDTLCVDKTGTLTDGTLKVVKVIPYGSHSETTLMGIINDLVNLIGDDTPTSLAMMKHFNHPVNSKMIDKLNFNSENKYSAITFSSGSTFILGSINNLNITNKQGVLHRVEEFTSNGSHVVILAKANKGIKNNKVEGEQEVLGMIVLQEQIRDGVVETFKAFKEDGVDIKVISGDDIKAVCEIAKQAGLYSYDNFISLEGLSMNETKEAALKYSVFGNATAEQKEWIISALKEAGHKVAMVGDGINDILALKHANCSIAMNDGAEATKNISDMVLTTSDFKQLRTIVNEGRKVNSVLYKTIALFLTKMVFAIVLSISFLFGSMISTSNEAIYPFVINHFYVWELFLIAIPCLFMVVMPAKNTKRETLGRAIRKSLGGSLAALAGVAAIFGMYHLQKYNVIYTGLYTVESAISMSVLLFTVLAIFALMKECLPFNKTSSIVFAIGVILAASCLGVGAIVSFGNANGNESLFQINYKTITPVNWVEVGITTVIVVTAYICITYIIEVFKGEHLEDNKSKKDKENNNVNY